MERGIGGMVGVCGQRGRRFAAIGLLASACGFAAQAEAATTMTTLGNDTPGFNDGDTPALFPDILNAQNGQPAPFDAGIGNELFGPDFSASWTFNYAPIGDPIISASITVGIFDHDSAASGDQVASFTVESETLTGSMNTAFEGHGGGDAEYNVYTVTIPASGFLDLADGVAAAALGLQGPGLQTALPIFGGGVSETNFNGAHLIFSTLTVETGVVPVPAALPLFGSAMAALGFVGWRKRRAA